MTERMSAARYRELLNQTANGRRIDLPLPTAPSAALKPRALQPVAATKIPAPQATSNPPQPKKAPPRKKAANTLTPAANERTFSPRPKEADVLKAALERLGEHPLVAWVMRLNTGAVNFPASTDGKAKKRHVQFGVPGTSDIVGMMKDGRFLAIEAKRPGNKPTENQWCFLASVAENNGVAGWIDNADQVHDVLTPAEGNKAIYCACGEPPAKLRLAGRGSRLPTTWVTEQQAPRRMVLAAPRRMIPG